MSSSSGININETITNIVKVYKTYNPSDNQTDPELTTAALNWASRNAIPTFIISQLNKDIRNSIIMNDISLKSSSLNGLQTQQIFKSLLLPAPSSSSSSSSSLSKAAAPSSLSSSLSSSTAAPSSSVLVAATPAQIAIDFFNDPAIAKPAPTAPTASLSSSAAPTAAPTAAPVKDKYGLINKLVTGTGTPAEELAAVNAVKQTLIEAAAGDTSHDFDDKKAISGITNLINSTYKDFYFSGLPGVTNLRNIQSEEQTIESVVQTGTFKFIPATSGSEGAKFASGIDPNTSFDGVPYSPLTAMKFIKEGIVSNTLKNEEAPKKPIVQDNGCTHEFTTVTGNDYICTYFDVKPEKDGKKGEIIDAQNFFINIGARENFRIGLIVDCVSITLEDIFNKGDKILGEKQVRLIKSSEGENDPGGKTNINDKTFKAFEGGLISAGKGIDYKAAIPLNIDKNKKYTYYYKPEQKTPYAWFLTNYRFSLSELQYSCKYLFSNLSTTLTITGDTGITPKVIPNSGEANEISQASIVIRNIIERIKAKIKGITTAQNAFDFNCPLQQKRSGDWLQALICALVAMGERQFCEFNHDIASIFKKKDLTTEAHGKTPLDFTDIYLVTHDRILLAFALLLGINVIFTHHYKATGKAYSYHSALVYKQKNPFEKIAAMNRVCQNFIEKITLPNIELVVYGKGVESVAKTDGYIHKLLEVREKLKIVKDKLSYQELYFETKLDMAIEKEPTTSKEDITTVTQNIFKEAFKLVMFNSSLPIDGNKGSIDKFIVEINTLIEKFKEFLRRAGCTVDIAETKVTAQINGENKLVSATGDVYQCLKNSFSQATTADSQPYFNISKGQIITYDTILLLMGDFERIMNQGAEIYSKLNNVISTVPDQPSDGKKGLPVQKITKHTIKNYITDKARTESIEKFEKEIGKNTTFLLISGWYPATPKCNLWVQYTNVLPPVGLTSAVINDKNVFLYNLTTLDDKFKIRICDKYIGIYETLKKNNGGMRAQAYESIMTFCFEVFINLGFRDEETVINTTGNSKNRDLKTRIDEFITLKNTRNKFILKDRTDEMNALSATGTITLTVPPPGGTAPAAAAATAADAAAAPVVLTFTNTDIIVIPAAGVALAGEGAAGEGVHYDPVKSSDVVPTILSTIEKETQYTSLLNSKQVGVELTEPEKTAAEDAATDVYDNLTKFTPSEAEAETKMDKGVDIGLKATETTTSFAAAKTDAMGKGVDVKEALIEADPEEGVFIDEIMTGGGGKNMVGGRKDTKYNINIDGFYNRQPPTTIELVKIFSYDGLTRLLTTPSPEIYAAAQTVISYKLLNNEELVKVPVTARDREEYEGYTEEILDTLDSYITKIEETNLPPDKIIEVGNFLGVDVQQEISYRRLASSSSSSNLASSSSSEGESMSLERTINPKKIWYIVNIKGGGITVNNERRFSIEINGETITVNCNFKISKLVGNVVISVKDEEIYGFRVFSANNTYEKKILAGSNYYNNGIQHICSPIEVALEKKYYYFEIESEKTIFIISGNPTNGYIFYRDSRNPTKTLINFNSQLDTTNLGGGSRLQKGGTNIEEIKQKIENQSILMNEIFGSHPYKPIYFTLYSYCRELDVTDIEQSWDYEQFIQFFVIMNEMVEKMADNLNTPDKNENMNAVVSGYGLRELIFTSHQYIERDDICKTALKITNEDYYNSLSKMFSILVNRICGTVNQPMEEVVENNKYIENPIFTAYIQQIPFQEILDSNIADGIIVYELNNQANKLLLAIGECIITDTNGISSSNNYKKLKGLTDGARGKYLLPNDSISDIASGLTKSLDLGETVNQLGDIKNQIGDAIGDAKDKIGNAIGDAIGAVSTDFKNVTEVVTSEPASETMYSNSRPVTPRKSFVSPLSSRIMTPIKVGGGTRKRRFVKVPKITRNQKLKKRKQTRNPRRKQTRRTNKRTRKHRN